MKTEADFENSLEYWRDLAKMLRQQIEEDRRQFTDVQNERDALRKRLGPAGTRVLDDFRRFKKCLECLRDGILPDGTHVEGRVSEYADAALKAVGVEV